MLGNRVPVSLKIFLTALAVADDLGAILVIALFYGGKVQITCLLVALVIMLGVYFMKQMGEKRMFFYLVPAVVVWGLFYYGSVAPLLTYNALFVPIFILGGLLCLVMSALFRQAAELKAENDLTI